VRFGNLPASTVDFQTTSIATRQGAAVALVRFNIWLPVIALQFESAMPALRAGQGVVIDLRGNPGGVAAVAQGVGGQFIAETVSLGTMLGRNDRLELVAQPRRVARDGKAVEPFAGPLAILIDEGSASTSEIFAAGLRDHDRARVFGTPSAGAALPAVMHQLPNGDVFMHASMDYIRPNGERVEGRPVVPDVETPLRRSDLKAGRDSALQAALDWIDHELTSKRSGAVTTTEHSESASKE
jgi:carboxyl-terminal processing protease